MNNISFPDKINYSFVEQSQEFKIQVLRECGPSFLCDTPAKVGEYIRNNILTSIRYAGDKENFVVLLLDARKNVIGFEIVSQGVLDSVLVSPREVFFPAIATKAHSVIVAHNHPSFELTPSTADIRVTRDLIRGGQILKIEILDHIIFNDRGETYSMKEFGFFYA